MLRPTGRNNWDQEAQKGAVQAKGKAHQYPSFWSFFPLTCVLSQWTVLSSSDAYSELRLKWSRLDVGITWQRLSGHNPDQT